MLVYQENTINRTAFDNALRLAYDDLTEIDDRKILAEEMFGVFFLEYFQHYVKYPTPEFHYGMFEDLDGLTTRKWTELAWIMFRESVKTSMLKAYVCYLIAYRKKRYINVDSYDKDNAEGFLFDVALELQTNKRIIRDFGHLYTEDRTSLIKTKKRVSDFITSNMVRVEAHSTQEPVRGRSFGEFRPDFLLLDDFETYATVDSKAAMEKVRSHIGEFHGGLAPDATIVYLGNYLTEYGIVQDIMDRAKTDPVLRCRKVDVADEFMGTITWPEKYVWTDVEANLANLTRPTNRPLVSLETKRRQLNSVKPGSFEAEMMGDPIDYTNAKFQKAWFKTATMQELAHLERALYITIDPPGIGKPTARNKDPDGAGFCMNWVTNENKWYLKAWKEQIGSDKLLNRIFDLWEAWHPVCIGIEQNLYTIAVEPFLKIEMRRRNVYPKIVPLETKGRPKEARIETLIPRYSNGDVFHLEGECAVLEDEALRFPKGKHDDVIDATSYQTDIARAPNGARRREQEQEIEEETDTDVRWPEIGV